MLWEQALRDHVEQFKFRPPGEIAQEAMKHASGRYFNLSTLPHLKVCAWCNGPEISDRRRRYCSADCRESAALYTHPQTPAAKAWVLATLQSGACSACGLDWTELLVERVLNRLKHAGNRRISWFMIGYGIGSLVELDHITPLHKGGRGIGFDNVQVICKGCHRRKTARDMKRG